MTTSTVKPPSSNTGAQITSPLENQVVIDWFAFTVKKNDPYEVCDMLGLKRGLFTELERGGMGYKKRIMFGHITIYFDGSENMGCHVEMSGQGCREYETSNHSWLDLIAFIELETANITRLDLAVDTVDGSLTLEQINEAVQSGRVRSRFSSSRLMMSEKLHDYGTSLTGITRYFGSGTSRVQFRIYDKQLESGTDSVWVRFELQLRDDRATVAASEILRRQNLGFVAAGIINQYLAFINRDDSNKSRCTLQDWWFNWLHHTEKLKITTAKAIKLVSQVQDYIKKQYAPTLAMIKKAVGVAAFSDFLKDCLTDGYSRLSAKHDQIILNSRLCADLPF